MTRITLNHWEWHPQLLIMRYWLFFDDYRLKWSKMGDLNQEKCTAN
ncbi:MAG: hypothetical protein ACKPGW_34260 [Microcystis panniformis]